jgi:chromosome condensin MukBEF MukE localization factor
MRAISLIAPALLAETRYVELVPEQIARSVRISEDEILDDLLYPADHSAVRKSVNARRPADSGGRS